MRGLVALLAALALTTAGMALASPVFAATIVVTEENDELNTDGDCSLREAIQAANTNAVVDLCVAGTVAADIITVPAGEYQLVETLGELDVLGSVTIVGAGDATTFVRGTASTGVFELVSGAVQLEGLTIADGNPVSRGGGGIAVYSEAELTLVDSTVENNALDGDSGGGGIYVGSLGRATIIGSIISANGAGFYGGGIHGDEGSLVDLIGSLVIDNDAVQGGGIASFGEVSLFATTVDGNTAVTGGGIIMVAGIRDGLLIVESSTISNNDALGDGNSSGHGGGILSDREILMLNSTVSGNTAAGDGAGIFIANDLFIEFSTITNNSASESGGGIYVIGTLQLFASIVANNADGGDCAGDADMISGGSNIDSDDSCGLDEESDQPSTDPMLGALADNGGPTDTHALLAGSTAIDAVVVQAQQECPGTDQREIVRPQDGDLDVTIACDIGAYELVAAVTGSASPSPSASPGASTLPDTAGVPDSAPSSAPWLGFALLALVAALVLSVVAVRRRATA